MLRYLIIGLHQDSRSDLFLRVPPVGGAGRAAEEAQDALILQNTQQNSSSM